MSDETIYGSPNCSRCEKRFHTGNRAILVDDDVICYCCASELIKEQRSLLAENQRLREALVNPCRFANPAPCGRCEACEAISAALRQEVRNE